MSFADETELSAFLGRDHLLPAVTSEAVARALNGFALQLLPGRDMGWLAMAVRRALAISLRNKSDGPDRTSNAEIRAELDRLSSMLQSTWQQLYECDHAVDDRLWTVAWRRWDGEGGNVREPQEYRRYKAAVTEIDWLSRFLRLAAKETPSTRGPWRDKERKWIRIQRGQYLAPIFEAAFGQPVTANNYGNDARHKALTPFMDFYARMVTLAFGAREKSNLAEVVKAACREHRRQPAQFAEGVIPGL